MITLPTLESAGDIAGKKVLLRLDLNVPIQDGVITDTYRIDRIISTIDLLRYKKAKVIILAHIETKENPTLLPVWHYINGFLPIKFSPDFFTTEAEGIVAELKDGEVMLFENLRMNDGEKKNDLDFAKKLAGYGDIYVNEAFSVSHRTHASIVGLPKLLPHFAGPVFAEEVTRLSEAFSPKHPFLFMLGGAKFETKLPLLEKFLDTADHVFVGGALANDIFKAKEYEVGVSLVSGDAIDFSKFLDNQKFICPVDVTVKKPDGSIEIVDVDKVGKEDYIGDCGPKTVAMLKDLVEKASFVLWNGPVGNYEIGFTDKTEQLAEILSKSPAETIVGGGDTLAAIEHLDLHHAFSFVSTGGGAMLDFLAHETLPGIDALLSSLH